MHSIVPYAGANINVCCSVSDFERHRKEMEIESRTLILQVNYLAEEVCPLFVTGFTSQMAIRIP